jgi:vacuolar-type H+-ATPase subunit I/STV1
MNKEPYSNQCVSSNLELFQLFPNEKYKKKVEPIYQAKIVEIDKHIDTLETILIRLRANKKSFISAWRKALKNYEKVKNKT